MIFHLTVHCPCQSSSSGPPSWWAGGTGRFPCTGHSLGACHPVPDRTRLSKISLKCSDFNTKIFHINECLSTWRSAGEIIAEVMEEILSWWVGCLSVLVIMNFPDAGTCLVLKKIFSYFKFFGLYASQFKTKRLKSK